MSKLFGARKKCQRYIELKNLDHCYLKPEKTGFQLSEARKIWVTAVWNDNILSHSYLEHKKLPEKIGHIYLENENTGSQLFISQNYWD